jgi:cytochrome c peroxidase
MSTRTRITFALLSIPAVIILFACAPEAPPAPVSTPLEVKVPLGLDDLPVPADNPMTVEKVELGKQLYFDKRLSQNGTVSCTTCHEPSLGWADAAPVSTGIGGQMGTRSAPTVLNAAYGLSQFWDGRSATLEQQAMGPIENPIEMGNTLENAVRTLNDIPGYRSQFQNVFRTDVTSDGIAKAIAAFERTILTGNSPWDRYQAGDKTALSEEALRGWDLFGHKAQCSNCHVGFNLTDGVFHNIGVGMGADEPDLGRYEITKLEQDKGAFKTPTLRNLTSTAPYMHDGSELTLESMVELYNAGGVANEWLDPKMSPLNLTEEEKADLVAFLKSLDGSTPDITAPTLP